MIQYSEITYIDHIVVEKKPKSVALNNRNIMPSVGAAATMYHDCHQVVQSIWVHGIVTLEIKLRLVNIQFRYC